MAQPRNCYRCHYWLTATSQTHNDGYIESKCTRAPDTRDWKWTRGSDTCSKWSLKPGSTVPKDYF